MLKDHWKWNKVKGLKSEEWFDFRSERNNNVKNHCACDWPFNEIKIQTR